LERILGCVWQRKPANHIQTYHEVRKLKKE
jgi:hypothetical protein